MQASSTDKCRGNTGWGGEILGEGRKQTLGRAGNDVNFSFNSNSPVISPCGSKSFALMCFVVWCKYAHVKDFHFL